MSVERKGRLNIEREGLLAELALQQHQIDAVRAVELPIQAIIAGVCRKRKFIGDPWFVLRDQPDLTRLINDRLAGVTSH